ncbi:MAG: type 4a pilus biogenesis protein PilO [Planctomycetota bacterium]
MNLISRKQPRWFGFSLHLLGLVATALTIGAFYGFVYQPLLRKQKDHASRTEQLDQLLLKQGSEAGEYSRLRRQLDAMRKSVSDLHHELAEDQSDQSLLAAIQGVAKESDLQVLDFQIGEKQSFATHSLTEVEFQCHGSYASICGFIQQAEQITKIAKLSNIEMQSRTNSLRYPIQLTFVLYSEGNSNDTKEKREVL